MECQEIRQRNIQELSPGGPFVLFKKLGVHVSGNPLQKGFKQVSDIVSLITDPSSSSVTSGSGKDRVYNVLCKLMATGGGMSSPFDLRFNQEAD